MAQFTYTVSNPSELTDSYFTNVDSAFGAVYSNHSGVNQPASAIRGMIWVNTSSATITPLNFYDGTETVPLGTANTAEGTMRVAIDPDRDSWIVMGEAADDVLSVVLGGSIHGSWSTDGLRLGNGTARGALDLGDHTDGIVLPYGTEGQRPAPVVGTAMMRVNSTDQSLELSINGGNWAAVRAGGGGGGGGATSLSALTDTDISSPSIGQYMRWNGTRWENTNFPDFPDIPDNIEDLDNVTITDPVNGQILGIDADGNVTNVNAPTGGGGGGGTTIPTNATRGQILSTTGDGSESTLDWIDPPSAPSGGGETFNGGAILNPLSLPDGTLNNPALRFTDHDDTGMYYDTTFPNVPRWSFVFAGREEFFVNSRVFGIRAGLQLNAGESLLGDTTINSLGVTRDTTLRGDLTLTGDLDANGTADIAGLLSADGGLALPLLGADPSDTSGGNVYLNRNTGLRFHDGSGWFSAGGGTRLPETGTRGQLLTTTGNGAEGTLGWIDVPTSFVNGDTSLVLADSGSVILTTAGSQVAFFGRGLSNINSVLFRPRGIVIAGRGTRTDPSYTFNGISDSGFYAHPHPSNDFTAVVNGNDCVTFAHDDFTVHGDLVVPDGSLLKVESSATVRTTGTDGDVYFNGGRFRFREGNAWRSLAVNIDDLRDVSFSNLADNQVLSVNARGDVSNRSLPDIPDNIEDLDNVTITSPQTGQFLGVDSAGRVVNANVPTGVTVTTGLTDVSDTAATETGQILEWNDTSDEWRPADAVPRSLRDLSNVEFTTRFIGIGEVLAYNGTEWAPTASPPAPNAGYTEGDVVEAARGSAGAPGYSFTGRVGYGMYYVSGGSNIGLGFSAQGSTIMSLGTNRIDITRPISATNQVTVGGISGNEAVGDVSLGNGRINIRETIDSTDVTRIIPNTIEELTNVTITEPRNSQVLGINAAGEVTNVDMTGGGGGTGATRIGQLSDVAETTPSDGDVLIYNAAASEWRPGVARDELGDLLHEETFSNASIFDNTVGFTLTSTENTRFWTGLLDENYRVYTVAVRFGDRAHTTRYSTMRITPTVTARTRGFGISGGRETSLSFAGSPFMDELLDGDGNNIIWTASMFISASANTQFSMVRRGPTVVIRPPYVVSIYRK